MGFEFGKPIDSRTKISRIRFVDYTALLAGENLVKANIEGLTTQMRIMFNNRNVAETVTHSIYGSMLSKPSDVRTDKDWVQIGSDEVILPSTSHMIKVDLTGIKHLLIFTSSTADTLIDQDIIGYGVNL